MSEIQSAIHQGDIYWFQRDAEGISRPGVIIQQDVPSHNHNRVTVCALTTNLKRASLPGSILLNVGEANLPKQSVVEVSKVLLVEKAQLGEYIGTLSQHLISSTITGRCFSCSGPRSS